MSSTRFFLLPCFIFLFSTCSKKKETNYNPSAALVKTVLHSQSGISESYAYDGNGQVTVIQSSTGSKTTFAYDSALITQTNYDLSGSVVSITYMALDTLGHVTGTEIRDAAGTVQGYHRFNFDAWGYERYEEMYTADHIIAGKFEWYWGDGNIASFAIYDSTATDRIYDTYYWYYDPAISSISTANKGQKYLGADSKYLVRKAIRHSYLYGDLIYTYEYSFDGEQRIIQARTYDHNGDLKNTDSYTYY
jgi:YD repeat-containing protein